MVYPNMSILQTMTKSIVDSVSPVTPDKNKRSSKKVSLEPIDESSSEPKRPSSKQVNEPSGDEKRLSKIMANPLNRDTERQDGEHGGHPPMTWRRFMAIFSLGCLLAAAQIPLYLIGGSIGIPYLNVFNAAYITADIGGQSSSAWIAIAYTLSLAAISPFAGAVSDLMGRRYASLLGALLVVVGMIIVGTAHRINVAIGGMAISGIGAGLAELIGTAGVAELAPTESRGKYVGIIYMLILPFAASSGYGNSTTTVLNLAQIYSATATWRWGAWINVILNGGTFAMLLLFYHPPPRPNTRQLSKLKILAQIDYIGGILSIGGFALFLLGLQWGGYN
jgi:MFS family permease